MAGAVLLTADTLATEWIFQDGKALTIEDISDYLQTKTEVDINERAYNYICETIAANSNRFNPANENGEIWGKIVDDQAYIIRSVFERICSDGGYSSRAVLSWLIRKNLVETSQQNGKVIPTKQVKINGGNVRCVILQMAQSEEEYDYINEII